MRSRIGPRSFELCQQRWCVYIRQFGRRWRTSVPPVCFRVGFQVSDSPFSRIGLVDLSNSLSVCLYACPLHACLPAFLLPCSWQTIGKTTKEKLNGDVETTFPGLLLSSTIYKAANVRNEGRFGLFSFSKFQVYSLFSCFKRPQLLAIHF